MASECSFAHSEYPVTSFYPQPNQTSLRFPKLFPFLTSTTLTRNVSQQSYDGQNYREQYKENVLSGSVANILQ